MIRCFYVSQRRVSFRPHLLTEAENSNLWLELLANIFEHVRFQTKSDLKGFERQNGLRFQIDRVFLSQLKGEPDF